MAIAIDKISNMTLPNYSGLGIAIDGLTAKQAALVLSTRNLSQAELEEVVRVNNLIEKYGAEQLVKTGLLSANSSLLVSEKTVNAEKLKESIIQSALNKEKAKEFIQTQLSVISDGEETASTIILNKALLDEAVKRGILTKEKAAEILSTYGVVAADRTELGSKKGLTAATLGLIKSKIALSALDTAAIAGVSALVFIIYKCNKVVEEARNKAQELGDSFKEASNTINDYKNQIEDLYEIINNSKSSISDVTNARKTLLSVQDELIDKFGTEKSVIDTVTDAINGQTEALDKLSKAKWQETKNEFNNGGFWNDTANFFQDTDNIERMLDEYGDKTILFKWADYADINKLTDEMVAELENIGIDIKVSTDNLQAIRDFDSLTESIEDTKGASLALSGNAEEIYNKLLALQNLISNDDSFNKLYDRVGNTADSYKELTEKYKNFYDQYVLQEKIFSDDSKYADYFKKVTDAAEKYNEAFTSGDKTKIKEVANEYADLVSTAMATAIANGDSDVATYFENMYPTLKSIVDSWNFNIAFDANTDDLQSKVQNVLDELKDENGRSLTAEEILGLGESNAQYQALVAIAHTYNMTIDEMIELLKKRNMVSAMDYQGLVGLFGQDNVDKLLPDDLEIAYKIENVGNMTFEQLQAEIQKTKEHTDESLSFFDKLTNSQESLDKFQSSIKSAADAYSTLMSGNYSSTNLVDSIQDINKAVTDMGGSLNWEFIDSQKNSLELLGNAIELISEKYAESVLSGAGIDSDSKFGQMLANNIIQAQKATTQLEVLDDQIDSLQSAYKDLTDIVSTYNETGYITFDQLQTLLAMEPQYLSCLVDENGQLQLNEAAMTALANKRLDDAEAQAVQQAITELGQLALQDEKTAVEKNAEAFTNAVDDLASYNAELANTIAEATLGASAIRDLNAAINGAESQGASDNQINTVLDNLKTKLHLIGNVREKVASGGLGSVIKSGGGSGSGSSAKSSAEDFDWIEQAIENVEKEIKELDEAANSSYSTFSEKNDALAKEIGKVTEEIELQQKAYDEYMRKADSIPLSEKYKELVRNGEINIETINDDNLRQKISEYQKWYDKAQNVSDAIKKLKTDIKDLHVDTYKLQTDNLKDRLDSNSITEKQYLDGLKDAYERFYADLEDFAQQYHEAKLDYLDKEKDYLNNVASAAASLIDKEINNIRDDADEQENRIKSQIELLEDKKKPLQDELDALEEKAKRENLILNLQKAQYAQAKAENQRNKLVYTYDRGMIYTNDSEAIRDAKRDVDDAKLEIQKQSIQDQINALDKEIDRYNDLINQINKAADAQIDALEKIKNKWQEVIDAQKYAENISLLTGEFGANAIEKILSGNDDDLLAQWKNSYITTLAEIDKESQGYIGNMTQQMASLYGIDLSPLQSQFQGVKESVDVVTNALGEAATVVGAGTSRNNDTTKKSAQRDVGNNKGTSLESAIQNETQTAMGAFDQHTDKITNEVIPAIQAATAEMNTFNESADVDIEKTITIHYETTGNLGGVSGHAHAEGTVGNAFANGTGAYKGLPKAEKNALVSEYGQTEMTVLPNGKTIITDTPTIMDLPKDTVIYNEEQTKKIMDNKVDTSGNAHADGTGADGWITLADGRQIRPLQPGDRTYDMMQKVNAYLESIDYNIEKLTPNSFYERNREMNELAKQINYVSSITNNRNVQPSINIGDINVTCPGVTSQEVMHEVGDALNKQIGHLSQRALQEAYKR